MGRLLVRALGKVGTSFDLFYLSPADTFDWLTDGGLIRQEYERYLPLPRLGEGRGEALAVGLWVRPPPVRPLPRPTSPRGDDSNAVSVKVRLE